MTTAENRLKKKKNNLVLKEAYKIPDLRDCCLTALHSLLCCLKIRPRKKKHEKQTRMSLKAQRVFGRFLHLKWLLFHSPTLNSQIYNLLIKGTVHPKIKNTYFFYI